MQAITLSSSENLLNFIEEIKSNSYLNLAIEKIKSISEFVNLGHQHGYSFSEADFVKETSGHGEITNDELMATIGGTLEDVATGASTCPCSWQD